MVTNALVWLGAIAGVLFAVGFIANKVLPGQGSDFVLEIPPMRRPSLLNITVKTVARVEWYLKEAVPLFILGTFVLWILDRLKVLGTLQELAAPIVVAFLGLPAKARKVSPLAGKFARSDATTLTIDYSSLH